MLISLESPYVPQTTNAHRPIKPSSYRPRIICIALIKVTVNEPTPPVGKSLIVCPPP